MGFCRKHTSQSGFTLIELIVVITLLGIISLVTVGFITSTMQGYADLTRRDQLSSAVRVAIERMAREIRNALPNSIRVNSDGSCLEFIPSLAASRYISVPLSASSARSSFVSVPFAVEPPQGRIAVYPIDTNNGDEPTRTSNPIYDLDSWSIISPVMSVSSVLAAESGTVDVMLSAVHAFPTDSPSLRYFIVDEPVSFCVVGTDLYRFQGVTASNYSYAIDQPDGATLLSSLSEPQAALLASDIVSPVGSASFKYSDATLLRNGIVLFDLFVQDQQLSVSDPTQESIRIQFEVQVKNVP
ncbi:MAG: MSHA biogenesis protein MshO [Neptuniibacter pectenicola]|jgi:MSHA biogenesis protein MshO